MPVWKAEPQDFESLLMGVPTKVEIGRKSQSANPSFTIEHHGTAMGNYCSLWAGEFVIC